MRTLALLAFVMIGCQSARDLVHPDKLIEFGMTAHDVATLRADAFGAPHAQKDVYTTSERFIPGENYTGMAYYALTGSRAQEIEFKNGEVVGLWVVRYLPGR
jgi:hypothetical protein